MRDKASETEGTAYILMSSESKQVWKTAAQAIIYGGGFMKSFSYIAQDAKNKQVKGVINAENEQ